MARRFVSGNKERSKIRGVCSEVHRLTINFDTRQQRNEVFPIPSFPLRQNTKCVLIHFCNALLSVLD